METGMKSDSLVGWYFFTLKDDKLCWQGRIVGQTPAGRYMAEIYSWLDGQTSVSYLIPEDRIAEEGWLLYPDAESWRFSAEHGEAYMASRRKPEK